MRRAKSDLPIPKISNTQAAYCLASIGAGLLLFVLGRASVAISNRPPAQDISQWTASFKEPDTLVVYAYANRDWEYPRNLAFFVRHGERALYNQNALICLLFFWGLNVSIRSLIEEVERTHMLELSTFP